MKFEFKLRIGSLAIEIGDWDNFVPFQCTVWRYHPNGGSYSICNIRWNDFTWHGWKDKGLRIECVGAGFVDRHSGVFDSVLHEIYGDNQSQSYEEFQHEMQCVNEVGEHRRKTTPPPAGQKFRPGQRVFIAVDLGKSMHHFPSGRKATVLYTYAHMYGGDNVTSYCLDVDDYGEVSWYYESQLTAVDEEWEDVING